MADIITTQGQPIVTAKAEEAIYKAVINSIQIQQQPDKRNDYTGKIGQAVTKDISSFPVSALGTPVMQLLKLLTVTYTDINGKQITTPEVTYDTVLLVVSQAKKIITTEIQGRDGTVKEYIGLDDYEVSINGIIVGSNGSYPVNQMADLKRVLDAPVAIPVACTYLNNLGIQSLVIKEYTINQEAGSYSKQDFNITAMSETAIELQII
jgi:hypothetical protein